MCGCMDGQTDTHTRTYRPTDADDRNTHMPKELRGQKCEIFSGGCPKAENT